MIRAGPGAELRAGWRTLVGCAAGVGTGLTGLPFYTFGTFLKPLTAEFGWSRSQVSLGTLFLQIGIVVTSPFLGRLVDRLGARRVALPSLVGLALGMVAVAASGPSLGSFYAAWTLVAFLGCATTPLTWTKLIGQRFDAARGLALGLVLAGTGLASLLGPRFSAALIAGVGWRGAYLALAAFVLFVTLPIAWAGTRESGGRHPVATSVPASWGMPLRKAARHRQLWMLGAGIFLVMLAQGGMTLHLVPLLTDRGMSVATATSAAGLLGAAVIAGRLVVGALVDRFHAPYVAACILPLPAAALMLLATSDATPVAIIAILLIGLAGGAEVDLLAYLASRYFGMRHYGTIYGTLLSCFAAGGALGPTLAGWSFDRTGGYDAAMKAGIVIVLAGATLLGTLGRYPAQVPVRDEDGAGSGTTVAR